MIPTPCQPTTIARRVLFLRAIPLAALALVALWTLAPAAALAGDDALPKAEDVLDNFVKVTGGKSAHMKMKTRIIGTELEILGIGAKMAITVYEKAPNRNYILTESDMFGKNESGVNGDVAWRLSAMMGPEIVEDETRSAALREAAFYRDVEWRKLYKEAKCVGTEEIDGKTCYKIELTPSEGNPETRYYEKDSGLLARSDTTLKGAMGEMNVSTSYSDYREVGGVKFAHNIKQIYMDGVQTMEMKVTRLEVDVDIPDERFEFPDQIKALIARQKEAKAGETPAESKPTP